MKLMCRCGKEFDAVWTETKGGAMALPIMCKDCTKEFRNRRP